LRQVTTSVSNHCDGAHPGAPSTTVSADIPASAPIDRHPVGDRIVLSIKGLSKAFGGQVVLDDVDADLKEGEVVLLRGITVPARPPCSTS
jgi:hypothetical protein